MRRPLAQRMRPRTIEEVVGQKHLLGEGRLLRRMLQVNRISSMILYGPPGTGKTSIASAIAGTSKLPFHMINAVESGKKDMEAVVKEARQRGQTLLFLDEIHRFNKAQQDYLLPYLESGLIVLVGATTENPYHDVNPTIRSRCQVFELKPLAPEEIKEGLQRALADEKRGLGKYNVETGEEVLDFLAGASSGDIRSSLNALEIAVLSGTPGENGVITLDLETAKECMQKKSMDFDKAGDSYYNLLSAFQKSIRGSDVHAAVYYLGRLLEGGDLPSVVRRLTVIAYEDVGLAHPEAGPRTVAACQAAERLGLPEARIPLSTAVIELCLSPKSNSACMAVDNALSDIRSGYTGEIPVHLKDAHYRGAEKLGHGTGYKYPHDYPNHWVSQQYLPDRIKHKKYYQPQRNGKEKVFADVYQKLEEARNGNKKGRG